MIKIDAIRKHLYDLYISNFQIAHPNVETRYVNLKFEPSDSSNGVFVNMSDQPIMQSPLGVGTDRARYYGRLVVDCTAPKSHGTSEIRKYLSEITQIYWNHIAYIADVGYITVEDVSYKEIREFRGYYTLSLLVFYRVDTC